MPHDSEPQASRVGRLARGNVTATAILGEVGYHAAVFFFFSSRRRHTRCSRDWSSDVCSSDLDGRLFLPRGLSDVSEEEPSITTIKGETPGIAQPVCPYLSARGGAHERVIRWEIGRASCRERV